MDTVAEKLMHLVGSIIRKKNKHTVAKQYKNTLQNNNNGFISVILKKMQLVPHREQLVSVIKTSHLMLLMKVGDFTARYAWIMRGRNGDVFVDVCLVTTAM